MSTLQDTNSQNHEIKHLISLACLNKGQINKILNTTQFFKDQKNLPENTKSILANKTVVNLFFESSTRTRSSFELAAKRLGADVVNFNVDLSSTKKGETLADTISNLDAMVANLFIVRHSSSGAAQFIAKHLTSDAKVINAGDGWHEHPTQGLLDLFTIQQHKPNLSQLRVAIVGDILHSRVARSQIYAFTTMGVGEIRVIAPKTLLPADIEKLGVKVFTSLDKGLKGVDVIAMLRLQQERMQSVFLPSKYEYSKLYGLTLERLSLADPNVLVIHPGPINRDVEISSEVADGTKSLILQQVSFGTAIRMAIMTTLLNPKVYS